MQQVNAASSSAAEVRLSSQSRPNTADEVTTTQNQQSQTAVVESVTHPAEGKQGIEATGNDRPLSQCPAEEEKPAVRAAADEGTNTDAGMVRPRSNMSQKAASQRAQSSSKSLHKDAQ